MASLMKTDSRRFMRICFLLVMLLSMHTAYLVFQSIDREGTGGITFGDFMEFLSVISKGSAEEKILWSLPLLQY